MGIPIVSLIGPILIVNFMAGVKAAKNEGKPIEIGSLFVHTGEGNPVNGKVTRGTADNEVLHLRLDTAANEIAQAEAAARDGNSSAAQFHAQEAYRSLETADEAVLELGQQLQQMVNLDIAD